MHIQTLSWSKLSSKERDARLEAYGVTPRAMAGIRLLKPRNLLLAAAIIALRIDQEPNSDLIEYIAGYNARSGLYHHFRSLTELLAAAGSSHPDNMPDVSVRPSELVLLAVIPTSIYGYRVHAEQMRTNSKILIWQKVNGGMRSVILNRKISKILFWSGVLLYATEGTMHTPSSSQVQFANTRPPINRLFLAFLCAIGIEKKLIKARIQLHDSRDRQMAEQFWNKELGLSSSQ